MAQISVIVPVYNCEQYLPQCLDSILSQTYSDLEILLIDDGSTDRSGIICDEYAARDSRILCLHQKNSGAAAARNAGLRAATGIYIAFVDSDDWLDPDMYEKMLHSAQEQDCDLVICDCLKETPDESIVYSHALPAGYYSRDDMKETYFPQLLMPNTMEYPVTISNWLLLIRRDVIVRNNLSFPEGMRFSEDLLFGSEVGYHSNSMVYLKGYTPYHYRQNPTSVTHSAFGDKWPLLRALYDRIYISFSEKMDYDFTPQIQRCMLFFVYMAMNNLRSSQMTRKEFFYQTSLILDEPTVRKAITAINISSLTVPWKLKILTFIFQKRFFRPVLLMLRN